MVAPQILKALPRRTSQHAEPWNYSQSMSICAPDPGSQAVPQVPAHQYLGTTITGDLASWIQNHDWSPWPGQHHWRQGDQEVCRRLEHQRLQQSSSHCRHLQPWPLRILVIFTDANVSWQSYTENYVTGLFTESELPHTPHLAPLYLSTSEGLSPPKLLWKVWKTSDFRLHQMCIYQFKDTRNKKSRKHDTDKRTKYFSVTDLKEMEVYKLTTNSK